MENKPRVYITDEQFSEYIASPQAEDVPFDESKLGDYHLWCHVCGEFSDYVDIHMVWHKYTKGDGETSLNVCPHCSGWDTVQDVGP